MALLQARNYVDYEAQQNAFEDFLVHFKTSPQESITHAIGQISIDEDDLSDEYDFMDEDDNAAHEQRRRQKAAKRQPKHKYAELMQQLSNREVDEVLVDLDDIVTWESESDEARTLKLVESIEGNTKHYVELISRAIDNKMPPPATGVSFKDDVLDVIMERRQARNREVAQLAESTNNPDMLESTFPAQLTRRYTLVFKPRTSTQEKPVKALAVRQVRGEHLGHLITIRGIATRVSDVKPIVQVGAYTCDRCGCEIFQPVNDKSYAPLTTCPSKECKENHIRYSTMAKKGSQKASTSAVLPSAKPTSAPQFPPVSPKSDLECRVLLEDQILLIDDIFSPEECKTYVRFIEALPLELTPPKKKGEAERVNHRISVTSPEFAQRLLPVLAPHLPLFAYPASTRRANAAPRATHSLNTNIRMYKYTPGQHFGPHYDDSVRDAVTGAKSEWTLLIYLTGSQDGVEGGETVFYKEQRGKPTQTVVAPLTRGTALLHRHGNECLLHEGSPVTKGTKYILRSDLMFTA